MFTDPTKMDKAEEKRVASLRSKAKKRPHLSYAKGRKRTTSFRLPRKILGYSSSFAAGDALRREILRREYALTHRTDGVVEHVRDGKPLTAKGAAILGVPWPPEKDGA
jgi:hypothetical protein